MATPSTIGASSKPPFVVPDDFSWDLSHFCIPKHYESDLGSVMIVRGLQHSDARPHTRSHSLLRARVCSHMAL